MDIQYVTDPYSCIMYIVSYITKAEKELSETMELAKDDILQNDTDKRSQLKQMAHVYFKNCEMSVQEAVYRVCSLRLTDCTREVVFIPTDENPTRVSLPLSKLKAMAKCDNESNIWMPNAIDKYFARPNKKGFSDMCLAEFMSKYRLVGNQTSCDNNSVFELQNNMGKVQRRIDGKSAVIRYMKYSYTDHREKHFLQLLKLYLPFRSEKHLQPPGFKSYESFMKQGAVKLSDSDCLQAVYHIAVKNQSVFEKVGKELEDAIDNLNEAESLEDLLGPCST